MKQNLTKGPHFTPAQHAGTVETGKHVLRSVIPQVYYPIGDNWRDALGFRMPRIGFAAWQGYPRIDDPTRDDETLSQQAERLHDILALPDDD
jgi:hypothetical protein